MGSTHIVPVGDQAPQMTPDEGVFLILRYLWNQSYWMR
jgi:hypothetical protein